jgi:hypothetical protein
MEYPRHERYSRTPGANTGAAGAEPSAIGTEPGVTGAEPGPKQPAYRASKLAR